MQFHDLLVFGVLILGILFVFFHNAINEEYQLLTRAKEKAAMEKNIYAFFEPLTLSERTANAQEEIALLHDLQNRLSKTLIAKHFVDYKEKIKERQTQLKERGASGENPEESPLSFSTFALVQIFANPLFDRVDLLKFGLVLDDYFSDSGIPLFFVHIGCRESIDRMEIDVSCQDLDDQQQAFLQTFFDESSDEIFEGKILSLQVNCLDGEEKSYQFTRSEKVGTM